MEINDIARARTINEVQGISTLSMHSNDPENLDISRNNTDIKHHSRLSRTIDESELRNIHNQSVMSRSEMVQRASL